MCNTCGIRALLMLLSSFILQPAFGQSNVDPIHDSSIRTIAPSSPCDGCGTAAYQPQSEIYVAHGARRPLLDGVGWIVGIPNKIMYWDRRAANHAVSSSTVGEVVNYLQYRRLDDTIVRVNQYAPLKEWGRLVENQRIHPGWKYTVGSLAWLKYTLLPGRVFGRDEYNPYSNSLSLYSDMPMLGLAEAAYAKDIRYRTNPGPYAAVQSLPVIAMYHETLATNEVVNYVLIHGSSEEIEKSRHDLYARYGIETAGEIGRLLPDGTGLFQVIGAVGGHGVAAHENAKVYRR